MNFVRPGQKLSLRFRRWSRRAWAVFSSLGREVTIGTLGTALTEKSVAKTHLPAGAISNEEFQQHREEAEEQDDPRLQTVELLPVLLAVPAGAVALPVPSITTYNGWYDYSRISRFLFSRNYKHIVDL